MSSYSKGPGLFEFLTEAELQQYFSAFKKELKVHNVGQLKFVTEEDLQSLGMSRPEIRRLKKYFQKHFPQTYISKFKKILLAKRENADNGDVILPEDGPDRCSLKVPNKHIIPAEAIVINKELGVGEFGVVQQGVWTNEEGERVQVAIKCLSKERMQSQPMEFLKEASIMHNINSEHIVRLYGVVLDTNALMLVTELAPLRSLLECLKESSLRDSFPVTTMCDFSVQICDGMCYLENKRLIHRDLAARNILVFSKNKVKISDFGLSRALGVGKDYYQTNFNVNLKLPIAWCAPECINYLRFTTSSDVWAFGVTLWEIFSYGFQPWAALTGQQILEAIDEPCFQRLEQPELCPKEYYSVMLKCWLHEAVERPKFSDLINILPDLRPEQVQIVKDSDEAFSISNSSSKKESLSYNVGDIVIVLDKSPVKDDFYLWKGTLRNGKCGLFNPANSVAYLGPSVPSTKSAFQRGDGRNAYSSKRRLRPEMISRPQSDFKHVGHVGLDWNSFGEVPESLIPQKNGKTSHSSHSKTANNMHSDDEFSITLTRASSDVSDRAPLLKKVGEKGKFGPASERHWSSDSTSEEQIDSPSWNSVHTHSNNAIWQALEEEKNNNTIRVNDGVDHEYHEISDEEDRQNPVFDENEPVFRSGSFDLGPSLMDEVFRALGGSSNGGTDSASQNPPGSVPPLPSSHPFTSLNGPIARDDDESNNVSNELKEIASKLHSKKKPGLVKTISATDERTLDCAIAIANEMASKSMLRLDGSLEALSGVEIQNGNANLPITPSSPAKSSKFSFKFPSRCSPKQERRHFSEEAASIPDIQASITEEAKKVYNSLVERPCSDYLFKYKREKSPSSTNGTDSPSLDRNPLRLLRQGMTVRPKIRGNKHNSSTSGATIDRLSNIRRSGRGNSIATLPSTGFDLCTHQTLPKGFKAKKTPPQVKPKPALSSNGFTDEFAFQKAHLNGESDNVNNPLPLPPRDRSKSSNTPNKPRHQRKYPLLIPGGVANSLFRGSLGSSDSKQEQTSSRLRIQHTHNPLLESHSLDQEKRTSSQNDISGSDSPTSQKLPPAKPPRTFMSLDDSFESQLASEIDEALDEVPIDSGRLSPMGIAPPSFSGIDDGDVLLEGRSLYQSSDHVSCEDLLDFALDRPNSRRTQGPLHGTQSDEVNLLLKVLKYEVSAEDCVETLDTCGWDVHRALKMLRLRLLLSGEDRGVSEIKSALENFSWDVTKAASYLATSAVIEDSAHV